MQSKLLFALSAAAVAPTAAEQVLGVYIFHRHGDRTSKSWNPVSLTPLGADQVASSAEYFRQRYIDDKASLQIANISVDKVVLSQLAITAPVDNVLQSSAGVFAQGLYPANKAAASTKLANGTVVTAPLNGSQYIPVNTVTSASSSNSEASAWLQGSSGCNNAVVSSNNYFLSPEYLSTFNATKDFYQGLLPVINTTFNSSTATFKNGYTIFDYINVATIHNSSIPSDNLLTKPTLANLYDYASTHEWNLAYNSSDTTRAIAGSVLAGQIVTALQGIADGKAVPKFNIQFGAYGAFMSFFGLAQLQAASNDFYGICNYASAMVLELVAPSATQLSEDDLTVRFLWSNGTAAENGGLKAYPLFGQKETTLSWNDFKTGINKFAVSNTTEWCTTCGNTDGTCASNTTASASTAKSSDNSNITKPVAGVIGALVTLGVILGIEALIILVGGLRLVKKSTLANATSGSGSPVVSKA
ncbi:phosphoglycerate mutase-like protein [Trichoderma evansii]